MRTSNVLFSTVHLFVILFIVGLGLLLCLLPHAVQYRYDLAKVVIEHPELLTKCGFVTLSLGGLLFLGFYALNRKQYYRVTMKRNSFSTSEELVKELLLRYWPRLFPEEECPHDIYFNHNRELEIILKGKEVLEEQENYLLKASEQIGSLLLETVGYKKDIHFQLCI